MHKNALRVSCLLITALTACSQLGPAATATPTPPPTITSTPTITPTSTPQPTPTLIPFAIVDSHFTEDLQTCGTNLTVNSVKNGRLGATVNEQITMINGHFSFFCWGAKHTWLGKLKYAGFTFDSDAQQPLQFTVDKDLGYVYIGGKGTVTYPDKTSVELPLSAPVAGSVPAPSEESTAVIGTVAIWKGIPVMPGATDGKEEFGLYSYTVTASPAEVRAFYQQHMSALGWQEEADVTASTADFGFSKDLTFMYVWVKSEGGITKVDLFVA
jgi:hypothetical protein